MTIGHVPDSDLVLCDGGCGARVHPDLRVCSKCLAPGRPLTVTFDVTNHHVAAYCEECSQPPDILRGEAVFLHPEGPIPYSLAAGRYLDSQIWGYIVGYDSAARRLEVAPKLDESGKFTITTPWIRLK